MVQVQPWTCVNSIKKKVKIANIAATTKESDSRHSHQWVLWFPGSSVPDCLPLVVCALGKKIEKSHSFLPIILDERGPLQWLEHCCWRRHHLNAGSSAIGNILLSTGNIQHSQNPTAQVLCSCSILFTKCPWLTNMDWHCQVTAGFLWRTHQLSVFWENWGSEILPCVFYNGHFAKHRSCPTAMKLQWCNSRAWRELQWGK